MVSVKRHLSVLAVLLVLCAALLPGTARAEGSLVYNGAFETANAGVPDGWAYGAWFRTEGYTEYGVDNVDGVNCAFIDNYEANDARFEQRIAVEPDTTYRFLCYVRAQGIPRGAAGASMSFENVMLNLPALYETEGAFVPLEFYAQTAPGQRELTLFLRVGGYSSENSGKAWFRDVAVEKADAPAGTEVYLLSTAEPHTETPQENKTHSYELAKYMLFALYALVGCYLYSRFLKREENLKPSVMATAVTVIMALAFALRVALAYMTKGYEVDLGCFRSWADAMAQFGPWGFYQGVSFCDYPPGYMLVLWPIGALRQALGLEYDSSLYILLIKLPAICADMIGAFAVYRYAAKKRGARVAFVLAALLAMNPATIFNSSLWGQMDSVLVMLLLFAAIELMERRMLRASLIYAVAVLVKPQALMFGTLLLAAFMQDIRADWKKGLKSLLACVAAAGGVFFLLAIPFNINLPFTYLFELYGGTLSSYQYAELNSFNLFALTGGNWKPQTDTLLGLSYVAWGIGFMTLSVAYALALSFKANSRKALTIVWVVMLAGVYVFGVRMHERYILPILAGLLLAYAVYGDKRLIYAFFGFTLTSFVNLALVLANDHIMAEYDRVVEIVFSSVNILMALMLFWAAFDICVRRVTLPAARFVPAPRPGGKRGGEPGGTTAEGEDAAQLGEPWFTSGQMPDAKERRLTRRDALMLGILMAAYSVLAFVNLGATAAPQTQWTSSASGEAVTLDFGGTAQIADFAYYGGVWDGEGAFLVLVSDDGVSFQEYTTVRYEKNTMLRWQFIPLGVTTRYMRLEMQSAGIPLMEVAFKDDGGAVIPVQSISVADSREDRGQDPAALIDEQQYVPDAPTYYNGTYFDEIYHARTAYEHIHLIPWYETSHPPLGKALMSLAVMLFGMTPFGWRFAGVVAGILMIPGIYLMARLLFKRPFTAFCAAFLLSVDLMHFTQTRIATIDSFGVLFIIWMCYFMLRYAFMNFYTDKLWRTLVPLLLSGICMGLGAAAKWIGAYSGIGLAVVLAYTLWRRYTEYKDAPQERGSAMRARFRRNTLITLLACVGFFVIIPIGIYIGSYWQYFQLPGGGHDLRGVWEAQKSMLSYHSQQGLGFDHPFQSPWYEWPLIIKPMFYYLGSRLQEGYVASINAMGNPAVWWAGFAAVVYMLVEFARGRLSGDKRVTLLLIMLGAQFLPWVLVPRSTYIYHYFASVPFIILLMCFFIERLQEQGKKRAVIAYLAVSLAVFLFFIPIVSGVSVPEWYAKMTRWMPWWTMYGRG